MTGLRGLLMAREERETEEPEITDAVEEAAAEAEEAEELTLEEQMAAAQDQAAEYLDGWQRARAELANYRRRTEAQRSETVQTANADLLTRLLPVLDDLQLALANPPKDPAGSLEEWRDGMALIAHKFAAVLEAAGVVCIEAEGQAFDPNVHEAISFEEHPDLDSGQVIEQVRQGFKLGSRVLRAASVRVAR
jgi:molecular chaperone GrpE